MMNTDDLRRARTRLDMTQAQLADAIGMRTNSIARMERGERPILKTTELSIRYLLEKLKQKKQVRQAAAKQQEGRTDGN